MSKSPNQTDNSVASDTKTKPLTSDYQETVILPRDKNDRDKKPVDYQETLVIPRQDLISPTSEKKASDYQETIAISRSELITPDKQATYQETVVLPREHIDIPKRRHTDYQETVAISRQEMIQNGKSVDYQETVALPRTKAEFDSRPPNYQETVAISRTDVKPIQDQKDYQETVVLPRTEKIPFSEKPLDYQETVAISKKEFDFTLPDKPRSEKTVKSDKESTPSPTIATGLRILDKPQQYEATIEMPIDGIEPPSETEGSYEASELEKQFFQQNVRGGATDKYRYQEKMVSGGMGTILKVLDQDIQRITAMKVIRPKWKNDLDTLSSFIREAKITGFLEHPNIIPVHELGLLKETGIFFTMKLAEGESLIDILNKIKNADPNYIEKYNTYHLLSIFRKVCDAISFAHARHIIHQDIKPHNIMVGQYGEVLLMDWGLAKYIGKPEHETNPVYQNIFKNILKLADYKDDMIKGSPAYMSPEQVTGYGLDKQSDIFLLGATLYHMFTLEPPFVGRDMNEVFQKAKQCDFIPPQIRNPARQIPEEICRIILKAMAPKKENRYQLVDDLSRDIDDLIAGKWTQQEKKSFEIGQTLMKEGDAGEEAYLILKGKLQVTKTIGGRKIALGTLKEGDIVGEMALITKESRSASVEALEQTEVAILTQEIVSENLKKLPPYMEKIVSTLTDRLRIANANIHPHLTTDCSYVVLKHLRLIFKDKFGTPIDHVSIPFTELIDEISYDLGLPTPLVKTILEKSIQNQIIVEKDQHIFIPDMNRLIDYTNSVKPME